MSTCDKNNARICRLFGDRSSTNTQNTRITEIPYSGRTASFEINAAAAAAASASASSSSSTNFRNFSIGEGGTRNNHFTSDVKGTAAAASSSSSYRPTNKFHGLNLSNIDLDIEHYSSHDLCSLFGIPSTFGKSELKQAYRDVLMTHPDKSGYPKEVFLFFSKAFRTLKSLYDFRTKTSVPIETLIEEREQAVRDFSHEKHTGLSEKKQAELAKAMMARPDFNEWFNENFEKARIKDEFIDGGYNEWFRSGSSGVQQSTSYNPDDIVVDTEGIGGNTDRMHEVFERRRREARAIIVYDRISETGMGAFRGSGSIIASSIDGARPDDYGSALFSGLQYEDLHKAYTETIVPVSEEEDYHKRPQYRTVDEYRHFRENNIPKPMERDEAEKVLMNQYRDDIQESNERAMRLLQQEKDALTKMREVWGSALRLTEN